MATHKARRRSLLLTKSRAAAPTQEISDDKLNMPLLRRDDASGMLFVNFDAARLRMATWAV